MRKGPVVVLTVFLMSIGCTLLYAQRSDLSVQALCEYAKERYDDGYLQDAMHEFSKLLIIDPYNVTALSFLKQPGIEKEISYLQEQIDAYTAKLNGLKKLMDDACGSYKQVAGALCEYAQERYQQGHMEDARHEFSKLLLIDPNNAVAKSFLEKPSIEKQVQYLEQRIGYLQVRLENLRSLITTACQ